MEKVFTEKYDGLNEKIEEYLVTIITTEEIIYLGPLETNMPHPKILLGYRSVKYPEEAIIQKDNLLTEYVTTISYLVSKSDIIFLNTGVLDDKKKGILYLPETIYSETQKELVLEFAKQLKAKKFSAIVEIISLMKKYFKFFSKEIEVSKKFLTFFNKKIELEDLISFLEENLIKKRKNDNRNL